MKFRDFLFGFGVFLLSFVALSSTAFAADLVEEHTSVGGVDRTYLVYQPDACVDKECPVVFMFHGLGGNAGHAAGSYYNWFETADQNEFVAVFPESLTLPGKSLSIFVWNIAYDPAGKHWDVMNIGASSSDRYCKNPSGNCSQDVLFFDKMLAEVEGKYDVLESSHVFTTGHSYGAIFSFYLAMNRPDVVTAFASHSGGIVSYYGFSFPTDVRGDVMVPGYVLYSEGDTVMEPSYSKELINQMAAKGYTYKSTEVAYDLGHDWEKASNQWQWDFFMENAGDLPEPPPPPPPPPVVAQFEVESGSKVESGGSVDVVVNLDGKGTDNIVLGLNVEGTAVLGEDFDLPGGMSIEVGATETAVVKLQIFSDDELEEDETIVLSLSVLEGNAVIGDGGAYTHTIIDDTPPPPPPPPPVYQCGDGEDNDGDGLVDMNDPGCENADDDDEYNAPPPPPPPPPVYQCGDGEDNDGDGLVDLDDPGCENPDDDDEYNAPPPPPPPPPVYQCGDGEDNDGDGLVDLDDPGCENPDDDDEYNAPPPPPPPPPVYQWEPKFLTSIWKNNGVVWENFEDRMMSMVVDNYGTYEFSTGYNSNYVVKDVEMSWKKPYYFAWALWHYDDMAKAGLYRRSEDGDDSLNKIVYFNNFDELELKDFALNKGGLPFVLWEDPDGDALVNKYNAAGVFKKAYEFEAPVDGFVAERILMDRYNRIQLLWVSGSDYFIETIRLKDLYSFTSDVLSGPAGYDLVDFDRGWWKKNLASRVLFVDKEGDDAQVVKVKLKGGALKTFDFEAPDGYVFGGMATTSDNRIRLMLVGDEDVDVWKINHNTGVLQGIKKYVME